MTALMGLATRLGLARLLLITGTRSGPDDLAGFADAAFSGGVDLLQLRQTGAEEDELLACLQALRAVAYRYQGLVSAYESGHLAQRFDADLLQLPERGMSAAKARDFLHEYALVGRSCHGPSAIDAALADPQVNFLTVGPVFPDAGPGLALVRYAAQAAPPADPDAKPWFAITGITADNLDQVLAAGARRVAVSRAITEADDPAAAAHALKDRLRRAWNDDPAMQDLTLKMFRR
ncbi:thiamine phosphate synthase [Propionicimonas paludicola]|nr:thiamine phosphate synthase [Propionicimonas paludicola]